MATGAPFSLEDGFAGGGRRIQRIGIRRRTERVKVLHECKQLLVTLAIEHLRVQLGTSKQFGGRDKSAEVRYIVASLVQRCVSHQVPEIPVLLQPAVIEILSLR